MSDGKTILVDVSRCTGCRGCQVACKQWNELPATDTVQTGSYQNPPDMNGDTYKIVRFREGRHENGKPYWNFFTDMCRHCVNPPCVLAADEGTMIHDEATGAVVYTEKTAENDFDVLLDACPYRIPRKNEKTGAIVKCTMCIDRISAGRHSRVRAVLSHRSHALRGTRRHARTRAQARGGAEEGVPQGPCRRS